MQKQQLQFDTTIDIGESFVRKMLDAEKRIYSFILTLVPNSNDAEDLLQETAALMWVKFNDNQDINNFTSWGIKIAHYKVLQYRQKKYSSKLKFTDEVLDQITNMTACVNDNLEERFEVLQGCLKKLPNRDRDLILLKHTKKLNAKSIAQKMQMTVASVYKTVPKVHDILLRCVKRTMREHEVASGS